jgi:uncharacterized protein (TIGR02118 family)
MYYRLAMIKLTVTYPGGEGITFDHDYYSKKHIPLCKEAFVPAKVEVDRGIDGPAMASASFYFSSKDDFQKAMTSPKMGEVLGDLGNYTNSSPTMQISEVVSS